ncbi:MAG TPA: OB-fold nucleic acid binding domain-containing protein, partial [Luteibaculaceae bacterium]|nr:OB-fold nucleic acid binding domain-containing protein [Luteibaculaceae bacterium]
MSATTPIASILSGHLTGQSIEVYGWVRTRRASKNVSFIALNDGSTIHNLQVVADAQQFSDDALKGVNTGACLRVQGDLIPSQGGGQSVELQATAIEVLGEADPEEYVLQPKR